MFTLPNKSPSSSKSGSGRQSLSDRKVGYQDRGMNGRKLSSRESGERWKDKEKTDKMTSEQSDKHALEKKVEELTRNLAEEKQSSRRCVAKLQREVARLKSERNYAQRGESREGLMKELERERMLRVDADQRLLEMRVESDSCRSRLQVLQKEFKRMEEMVLSMLHYKTKIDQLKQEKSNLSITYETNIHKYSSHISSLERENMLLLNEVKKLESQLSGKGDDLDKSKLLLQRLKMLEAENSALVLENEQQRHQYEKCLDEIANQVVQALLAQKTLREECMKLQGRVQDLELQNRQLNIMFQQRLRFASDSVLHSLPSHKLLSPCHLLETKSPIPVGMTAVVPPQTQPQMPVQTSILESTAATSPPVLESSTGSLQSMCSEHIFDDSPGMPQMSSPPPWVKEKVDLHLTDDSCPSSSDSSLVTTLTLTKMDTIAKAESSPALQTRMETEFPANKSRTQFKHVSGLERGCQTLDRIDVSRMSLSVKNTTRPYRRSKSLGKKSSSVKNMSVEGTTKKVEVLSPSSPQTKSQMPSRVPTGANQGAQKVSVGLSSEQRVQGPKHSTPQNFHDLMLKRKKAFLQDSSPKSTNSYQQSTDSHRHTLPFRSQYYYDYSDEDSDSRPVSRDSSTASTVSLNDLLDNSLDMNNPLDEDFLSDWSPCRLTPDNLNSSASGHSQIPVMTKGMFYKYQNSKHSPKTVKSGPYTEIIVKDGVSTVVKNEDGFSGCKPLRPDNLILVPREKQFSCGFSSSSSSSAEEPKSVVSSLKLKTIDENKGEPTSHRDHPESDPQKSEESQNTAHKSSSITGNSSNKNCVVGNVSIILTPPEKIRKVPSPVSQKPQRLTKLPTEGQYPVPLDNKCMALEIVDKVGMPFLSENLTIEKQKDLAAFLVQDVIERVKRQEAVYLHKTQSSESSFENMRVERSGSKDDGYSTMSSDIQPEILEKFNDTATQRFETDPKCVKTDVVSIKDTCSVKTKDAFTDVMSDHDSAMETSTHSMELHNSNQSISSQMSSSSSCESAVSPVLKVNDMKKFFEEETKKKGAKHIKTSSKSPISSPKSPKKHWSFNQERHAKTLCATKSEQHTLDTLTSSKDSRQDDGSIPAADIIFQNFFSLSDNSNSEQTTFLHISEDKLLEDIPEDDEWEAIHNRNIQDNSAKQRNSHHSAYQSNLQTSIENLPSKPIPSTQKLPSFPSSQTTKDASAKLFTLHLCKAKSDSNLLNAGQSKSASLYEDFIEGNWDSGKVPERSASVSEMDFQPLSTAVHNCDFRRQSVIIDIDETSVLYRVHNIVREHCQSKMSPALYSDSESDNEAQINFIELLKQKSQRPFSFPTWSPKQTLEVIKKTSTPSPVSVKKFDSSSPEDWLLQFSKEEIDKHIAGCSLQASSPEGSQADGNRNQDYHISTGSNVLEFSTSAEIGSFCAVKGQEIVIPEETSSEENLRSLPSEEQTKFNSVFYSLCNIGSNRSLFSIGSHDQGINKIVSADADETVMENIESKEFEEISRRIASLSKTVDDLHRSLSSLNSADSGSNNEIPDCHSSINVNTSQSATVLDGYHWVDDEFCMASCGGEVIIGSNELLADGSSSWVEDFTDDSGPTCDLDQNSLEIYEIQVNGNTNTHLSGHAFSSDGSSITDTSSLENKNNMGPPSRILSDSHVADPQTRADLLDSMLASGGDSNDSLVSDIGLDHMMCQRLIGFRRQAPRDVVRCPPGSRPSLDFSKFFIRYAEPEREAVAAFDFLEDMSTSNSESDSLPRLMDLEIHEFRRPDDHQHGFQIQPYQYQGHTTDEQQMITSSQKIKRVNKNKRRKQGDAMKAQKQRENQSRICVCHVGTEHSAESQMTDLSDEVSTSNLSLSDSCCEGFSSSNPSVNDLTML